MSGVIDMILAGPSADPPPAGSTARGPAVPVFLGRQGGHRLLLDAATLTAGRPGWTRGGAKAVSWKL